MQRQSLGSTPAVAVAVGRFPCGEECEQEQGEEGEDVKKMKLRHRAVETRNYIHLIPLLTLICFLILFLNSHKPTENGMTQFNGVEAFSHSSDSDVQGTADETKIGIVFAAATTAKQRRLHRKLGRF